MTRHVALLAAAAALLAVACGPARENPEPPTDIVRKPEIIGLITQWDMWEDMGVRYTLDTGDTVELNVAGLKGQPKAQRLSTTDIYFPNGNPSLGDPVKGPSVLLLVGHDADGSTWYAAAQEQPDSRLYGDPNPCPFEIRGAGVYDEGSVLHFSTGLVLPKSRDFKLKFDYDNLEEFPLRGADHICIDGSGTALWALITLQGY